MQRYKDEVEIIGFYDGFTDDGEVSELPHPISGEPVTLSGLAKCAFQADIAIDDMPTYYNAFHVGQAAHQDEAGVEA